MEQSAYLVKSEQERAADRVKHEMDFLWSAFRTDAESAATHAIRLTSQQNNAGNQHWQSPEESLREVQKACVMRCFAMIDGLSQYVRGGSGWDHKYNKWLQKRSAIRKKAGKTNNPYPSAQTRRMMSFMHYYMGTKPTVARLAIEMYRHMLMHEGILHGLTDDQDRIYSWYLSWDAEANYHLCVRRSLPGHTWAQSDQLISMYGNDYMGKEWNIEIGTLNLIADVERAIAKYVADLRQCVPLYHPYERLTDERWGKRLKWTPRL